MPEEEIDLGTCYELKRELDETTARCEMAGGVVADLSWVESVTLGVLVEQRDNLRNVGRELVLVVQGTGVAGVEEHPVGRFLHLTGQAGEFSIYDVRVAAVRSVAVKG